MAMQETTIWGIHAGRNSEADNLFLNKNCIAIGWIKMGNLGEFKADREVFKEALAKAYPDRKAGAIPVDAGQLLRFVHEMKEGISLFILLSLIDRYTLGKSMDRIYTI